MNKKSFLLGFAIAVLLFLAVGAISDAPEIGRYQIAGVGPDTFIVDTTTGVVKHVFTRGDAVTKYEKQLGVPFSQMTNGTWK
jgi:hypothetical protein